jgi:hypothetical protein
MNVRPGPDVATLAIGTPIVSDRNPSVAKTTNPPKMAVPKLTNDINTASKWQLFLNYFFLFFVV